MRRIFTAVGSATGLGDLMVRLKGTLHKGTSHGLAVGLDMRLPTGDEMNLLGSGAAGLQPFAIWSATYQKVSPHVNASYKWNGSSVLAGNPARGESADFPDQAGYAAGADVSVNPRLTLAFDLLGVYVIDAERLRSAAVPRARRPLRIPEHRVHDGLLQQPERLVRPQGQRCSIGCSSTSTCCSSSTSTGCATR